MNKLSEYSNSAYEAGAQQALADFGIKVANWDPRMEKAWNSLREPTADYWSDRFTTRQNRIARPRFDYLDAVWNANWAGSLAAKELAKNKKIADPAERADRARRIAYDKGYFGGKETIREQGLARLGAEGKGSLALAEYHGGLSSPKFQREALVQQAADRAAAGLNQYGGRAGTQSRINTTALRELLENVRPLIRR